jgi:hypothetical protein
MRLNGQIGKVPYEPGYPVITSWDLGINDPTVIIFANICGKSIHLTIMKIIHVLYPI